MTDATSDIDDEADAVEHLVTGIKAVLIGQPGHLQGAAIGEALALWLAGHPDFLREPTLSHHLDYVRALIPEVERELFAGGQHPGNLGRRPCA